MSNIIDQVENILTLKERVDYTQILEEQSFKSLEQELQRLIPTHDKEYTRGTMYVPAGAPILPKQLGDLKLIRKVYLSDNHRLIALFQKSSGPQK